ncbi:MAG: helix-turn-helix transcriptional regulator [Nitrospiraceae bacterium]|nr:helix-turn-helix transcriptional regulator [Nitrospiraceae bacterium]
MKESSILDKLHEKYKDHLEYQYEEIVYDFTETVAKELKEKGWSRKLFAEKLGVTPAYVTKLLYGTNLTIKQMLRVASVIGCDLSVSLVEKTATDKATVLKWPKMHYRTRPRAPFFDRSTLDIKLLEAQNVESVAA